MAKEKRVRRNKREIQRGMRSAGLQYFKYTGPIRRAARYMPNEPCPCGSGRKSKRCCRGKQARDAVSEEE